MRYKIGCVSLQGSYHDINQDYARAEQFDFGAVLALSDGLGSRKLSQYGSKCLCDCAVELAEKYKCVIADEEGFICELQNLWIARIKEQELDIKECYCTALIVVVKDRQYSVFHLGDGVLAVMADDQNISWIENKEEDFCNYTDPLTEKIEFDKWQHASYRFNKLQGIYLSSDGVELPNYSEQAIADFMYDFIEGYKKMSSEDIEIHIASWLENWPTADDKTIAFLLREDIYDAAE